MNAKKFAYYLSKFSLIDEVLGMAYWIMAIYGLFSIIRYVGNHIMMASLLIIYIVAVAVFYIFAAKRIKTFFKGA